MLARLLRRLLLSQLLLGAGLGFLMHRLVNTSLWGIAIAALAMPIACTLLVVLVTAIKSQAREPWSHWWRSVLGECVAGLQIFLLRQPWSFSAPGVLPAIAAQTRVPVVLVHGYVCNHRIWDDVARALRSQGHCVLAVNLEPLFTSIDNYATIVEAAVEKVCSQTGAAQVALVGHSMGGLAIRAWMRSHGAQRVAKVLTLGTPHAGTQIESRSYTPNGEQMRWQSPWLGQLLAEEPPENHARIRIAVTPQDNIVFPQRAQILRGVPTQVFDGLGHLQMCVDPAVIAWVCEQLVDLYQPAQSLQPPSPALNFGVPS